MDLKSQHHSIETATLNYNSCRRILIYFNKVKMAESTLTTLVSRTSIPVIHFLAKQRILLLKKFVTDLNLFLNGCKSCLPYIPSERCKAVTYWFGSQRLIDASDLAYIKRKIEIGDNLMYSECIHILSDLHIPEKLKNLLENHLFRISSLHH
jgi:hypothetical protein